MVLVPCSKEFLRAENRVSWHTCGRSNMYPGEPTSQYPSVCQPNWHLVEVQSGCSGLTYWTCQLTLTSWPACMYICVHMNSSTSLVHCSLSYVSIAHNHLGIPKRPCGFLYPRKGCRAKTRARDGINWPDLCNLTVLDHTELCSSCSNFTTFIPMTWEIHVCVFPIRGIYMYTGMMATGE